MYAYIYKPRYAGPAVTTSNTWRMTPLFVHHASECARDSLTPMDQWWVQRSVLQCVAACCSALQCVAVCCSALHCVVVCCSVHETHWHLRTSDECRDLCVAVCCSVLRCVAVRLQSVAVCCSVLRCVAVCTRLINTYGLVMSAEICECVAVCCGVSQCVVVCCRVLRCVTVCGLPQRVAVCCT